MEVSGLLHAITALSPREEPRYLLDRRPGGTQSRFGRDSEEKYNCLYRKSNSDRPARSLVTILTELSRLLFIIQIGKQIICNYIVIMLNSAVGRTEHMSEQYI
jgi:hypothetical protein